MKLLAVAVAVFVAVLVLGKVYVLRVEQVRERQEQRIVCELGPYGSDPVDQRCPRY